MDKDFLSNYFATTENLESIFRTFPNDEVLQDSRKRLPGLRLLNQDPWESLISFVCSINCNIPSIKNKIEKISRKYGRRIYSDLDLSAYSFPDPEPLARASQKDLMSCSLGFRWRYVKFIAEQVASGDLDLNLLSKNEYHYAMEQLVSNISGKTLGVGPKVADCTLLYSMHKTEAFPIDIWILRCMKLYYDKMAPIEGRSLTQKSYFSISESMRKRFGKYAGYAQLYLYAMMRSPITRYREPV